MSLNTHPRRSQKLAGSPPSLHINSLRKSDTFSARTGLRSSIFNPRDNSPLRPQRSPTSLDENFVLGKDQLAATRQEIVDKYLRETDDAIQRDSLESSLKFLNHQEVLAVPSAVANQIIIPDQMDIDEKKVINEHHHCSDSGLGSSIDTPQQDTQSAASVLSSSTTAGTVQSAITKSFSAESINSQNSGPALSADGLKQIQESILDPLLANLDLKDFHPLIAAIPSQAQAKIISNLRDLEKQFLYGAPRFSSSAKSFLKFWEFSIQCLHTTVDLLTERDQKRPSDRPYTNNYFLDLVEQINRYAAIMRQTRERQERGDAPDDMDYTPGETLTIEGGFSVNGRPAELVRKQNGKAMSLIPEETRSQLNGMASSKRAFQDDDDESDDDDILRSMARRRKSEKAGDVIHVCSDCKKEFKRPCDLTKHEKTHSRPFKCSEPSCRYHELGWPTEKERDRHVNDKHSDAPKMFSCEFANCSYSSKRESNCKQHMEKAHGWTYVRSKSNGRKRGNTESGSVSMTPSTPMSPFDNTPGYTPQSTLAQSPWSGQVQQYGGESSRSPPQLYNSDRRDSVTTSNTHFTHSSMNDFSPVDWDAKLPLDPSPMAAFLTPDFTSAHHTSPLFDTNMPFDFGATGLPAQYPPQFTSPITPETMAAFSYNSSLPAMSLPQTQTAPMQPSHYSPTGHGDLTLYSTEMDSYGGAETSRQEDFVLFPSTSAVDSSSMTNNWAMDTSMTNFGGQFDSWEQTTMFPPQ